jgi:hypothetical protein
MCCSVVSRRLPVLPGRPIIHREARLKFQPLFAGDDHGLRQIIAKRRPDSDNRTTTSHRSMPGPITDLTAAELDLVHGLLLRRHGTRVATELADSELLLAPGDRAVTVCPTVYWSARGAHFVVCKVATGRHRGMFFYSDAEQYGTGRDEYDDLEDCVTVLLRVQSDHERQRAGAVSGATADDLDTPADHIGPAIL